MKTQILLTLNAGSSSLKFAVFRLSDGELSLWLDGQVAGIGTAAAFHCGDTTHAISADNHHEAIQFTLHWLNEQLGNAEIVAAGHRVVHGGQHFTRPQRIDEQLITALEALIPLAPHHQPHNITAIKALAAQHPELPQVACFDTAFHATQPEVATRLPIPQHYRQQGIRRYGFHGLSYQYIAGELARNGQLPPKTIVAHLGNGASLCALQNGQSIDTSMGFSTLDGLMMGTRCGTLDPGVILHWLQEGMEETTLTDLLYNRCGLKGVSGISADMRTLLASDEAAARQAIEQFCYTLIRLTGSQIATLQGLDALVFTGGIGERAAVIREQVCQSLHWMGLVLDNTANRQNARLISTPDSRITVRVIPTNEEQVIARHTLELVSG